MEIKSGGIVKYNGCEHGQWVRGDCTNPIDLLVVGGGYEVEKMEVYTAYTKLILVGVEGEFNSVCFTVVDVEVEEVESVLDYHERVG